MNMSLMNSSNAYAAQQQAMAMAAPSAPERLPLYDNPTSRHVVAEALRMYIDRQRDAIVP